MGQDNANGSTTAAPAVVRSFLASADHRGKGLHRAWGACVSFASRVVRVGGSALVLRLDSPEGGPEIVFMVAEWSRQRSALARLHLHLRLHRLPL